MKIDSFDVNGNVANFVGTEQIVKHNDTLSSFVQIRGMFVCFEGGQNRANDWVVISTIKHPYLIFGYKYA